MDRLRLRKVSELKPTSFTIIPAEIRLSEVLPEIKVSYLRENDLDLADKEAIISYMSTLAGHLTQSALALPKSNSKSFAWAKILPWFTAPSKNQLITEL